MKVWIAKYALTSGIQAVDANETDYDGMISYRPHGISMTMYAYGQEWHRTPEAAEKRAEEMRKKKIASLKKSLANFESMEIKAPKGE